MASNPSLSTAPHTLQQVGASYLRETVLSASPAELTLLSFEGILRFLKRAELLASQQPQSYTEKMDNIAELNESIARAQALVSDLNAALNEEAGSSVQEQAQVKALVNDLRDQYYFLNQHLSVALVKRNPLMIGQALVIVQNFRDGWEGAMENLRLESDSSNV